MALRNTFSFVSVNIVQNNPSLPLVCLGFRFPHDATCDWWIIGETPAARWKKCCRSSNVVRNLRDRYLENGRGAGGN